MKKILKIFVITKKKVLLYKFENVSSYNQHGTTMFHDKTMFLLEKITMTNSRNEFFGFLKKKTYNKHYMWS